MRQFWIVNNGKDSIYDSTTKKTTYEHHVIDLMEQEAFGSDPSGLGASIESTDYQVGTDIIETNKVVKYDDLNFIVTFGYNTDNPYDKMREFINLIARPPLTLYYTTEDTFVPLDLKKKLVEFDKEELKGTGYEDLAGKVYKREVSFLSASKSEIDKDGYLKSEVHLKPLSPWYVWEENYKVLVTGTSSEDQYFFLEVDTTDIVHMMENSTVPMRLQYTAKRNQIYGDEPDGYFYIKISADGFTESTLTFETPIESGTVISIDSDYTKMSATAIIKENNSNKTTNLMSSVTSNSVGFLRVPAGTKVVIRSNGNNKWDPKTDHIYFRKEMILV